MYVTYSFVAILKRYYESFEILYFFNFWWLTDKKNVLRKPKKELTNKVII